MPTTTNYGWTTPADTDLVKDGAAAIRTLGSGADTTVKNLNPGTTAGDIDYYTSGTAKARIAIGTAGQVLTVNSGATAPQWASPASGGMTLINTGGTTLTGASVLISSIPATYNDLYIVIRNFKPTNDGYDLTIRVNDDSNANRHRLANDFSSVSATAFNDTLWNFGTGNDNTVSQYFGLFQIWDYANTTTWKLGNWYEMTTNGTTNTSFNYRAGRMMYNQTGAISSFRIATESGGGDLNGGTVLVYGVK